jgi:hypothetical protein
MLLAVCLFMSSLDERRNEDQLSMNDGSVAIE